MNKRVLIPVLASILILGVLALAILVYAPPQDKPEKLVVNGFKAGGMTNNTDISTTWVIGRNKTAIVNNGAGGSSDEKIREIGNIVKNSTHYNLYYTGQTSGSVEQVHLATATDLMGTWTKYANNPVVPLSEVQTEDPYVWLEGSNYHMFAENKNGTFCCIAYLNSTDAVNWNLQNATILQQTASGWDNRDVSSPVIYKNSTKWYMLYEGRDTATVTGEMALATADYPWGAWTKYAGNPVFTAGSSGTWDDEEVVPDDLYIIDDVFYLIYHGHDGTAWRVGLANSTDLVNWNRVNLIDDSTFEDYDNISTLMFMGIDEKDNLIASLESSTGGDIHIYQMYG